MEWPDTGRPVPIGDPRLLADFVPLDLARLPAPCKGYPPGLAYRVVKEALEQEGIDLAAAGIDLDNPPDPDSAE